MENDTYFNGSAEQISMAEKARITLQRELP